MIGEAPHSSSQHHHQQQGGGRGAGGAPAAPSSGTMARTPLKQLPLQQQRGGMGLSSLVGLGGLSPLTVPDAQAQQQQAAMGQLRVEVAALHAELEVRCIRTCC